jgi:glycosyltransferase involved in cell wall biosynthesis
MKILHVSGSVNPEYGGVSEAVYQIGGGLLAQGIESDIVSLDPVSSSWVRDDRFHHVMLGKGLGSYGYNPELLFWLRENVSQYHHVIVHGLWMYHGFAVRKVCLEVNVPYSVYPHGMLDPYFKNHFPLKHLKKRLIWPFSEYRTLRDANMVLFTCEEEKISARESFSRYLANERVGGLGIEDPKRDAVKYREDFFKRYPHLKGRRLFLFLGRIHPKKGCDILIRSFVERAEVCEDIILLMVGPDSVGWKNELLKLIPKSLMERVLWMGMLRDDEKWEVFCASELFVLPSHQENFGISVVEAMACSLPVLISDKVNIYREISIEKAGFVCSDTFEELDKAMKDWIDLCEEDRVAFGEQALHCFRVYFEIGAVTKKLSDLLMNS